MQQNKIEVEALIKAIRNRQVLYDKGDDNYSNRVLINQKWKEVAEEVGTDDTTARKKWAVLRDSFRKHHKKETTNKSESGGKDKKKWYLYNSLLFLVPFIDDRINLNSSNLVEGLKIEQEYQQASFHLHDAMDDSLSSNSPARPNSGLNFDNPRPGPSSTPNSTIQNPTPLTNRKRPYPQDSPFDAEMLHALKRRSPDPDEQFLLSLAPVLKSLDLISKMELRGELNATALRYLRRAQQPSQYGGLGHPSQSPTPTYRQSPSHVTTEDSYQYSQYTRNARAQVHRSHLQDDDS